jgi:hypothetical protein
MWKLDRHEARDLPILCMGIVEEYMMPSKQISRAKDLVL